MPTKSIKQSPQPVRMPDVKIVLAYTRYSLCRMIFPADKRIQRQVLSYLTVKRKERNDYLDVRRGAPMFDITYEPCYILEQQGENYLCIFGTGFLDGVRKVIEQAGFRLVVVDRLAKDVESFWRLLPDVQQIKEIQWRESQQEIIEMIRRYQRGQFIAPTGGGKSFLIAQLCRVYPRAKIIITTYARKALDRLYQELVGHGIDVGIYSSEKRQPQGRVLCCTVGCLHNFADKAFDILIADERHELATSMRMKQLASVKCRWAYGFSANEDDRTDDADFWTTAILGPVRNRVDYKTAEKRDEVAPMRVHYKATRITTNDLHHMDRDFNRVAIWANEARNQIIYDAYCEYRERGLTLVYAKTVEHLYRLRQFFDCPVVHAPPSRDAWQRLIGMGLVARDEPLPNHKSLAKIQQEFSDGKHPVVLANSVWKRAVDFPALMTVIRADAGSSTEDTTQICGRPSRKYPGKEYGLVVDLWDDFNDSLERRRERRTRDYRQLGWLVRRPDGSTYGQT